VLGTTRARLGDRVVSIRGKLKRRLATSTTRSILDSIDVRLDESRDITRYISNLLIFLGLLGTFWGLSLTVPAVVDTIKSLAPQGGDTSDVSVFDRLMTGLESQLGGMGTAFASSLVGLAGSLVVGLLELFAGHGQNRFYRELEEWLTSFTRLGLVSEGEGPEGALISLLERVDEGLERTTDFAESAEQARIEAEKRLAAAADVVAKMATEIQQERTLVSQLVAEMREARELEAGRDHATLAVLKRIDHGQSQIAARRFQCDCCGHNPCQVVDITTHDHNGADLCDCTSKTCKGHCHQGKSSVPQKCPNCLHPRQSKRAKLLGIFGMQIFKDLPRQSRYNGCNQDGLGDDHRGRRVKQAKKPQRSGARQVQVND